VTDESLQPPRLHTSTSVAFSLQSASLLDGSLALIRVRSLLPLPHVLEHALQVLHIPHSQVTGQPIMVQLSVSMEEPLHSWPPLAVFVLLRLRSLSPVPQLFEHFDHSSHGSHLHSTLQCCSLQCLVFVVPPVQFLPPFNASLFFFRVPVSVPLPHDLVQVVQLPHSPHSQSPGQASVLQSTVSDLGSLHAFPPYSADVASERFRTDLPVPQVLEQSPHFSHSPHSQSMGQGSLLHAFSSLVLPVHGTPPLTVSFTTLRERM